MNLFRKRDTEPPTSPWNRINWNAVTETVRRMQTRIVKALEGGQLGPAKKLQRLLVNSTSAKLLAVRQVVSNRGKNTPGIDGVLWKTPRAKYQAAMNLTPQGYKALPLRRVYIPKSSGNGQRKLGIPTMYDRAMQALYALALAPIAETLADPNSYGFRKERSVADAIAQCFMVLAKKNQAGWILEGDIRACFDQKKTRALLGIPKKQRIQLFVAVGVANEERSNNAQFTATNKPLTEVLPYPPEARKSLEDIVHHRRYGNSFVELEPGRTRAKMVGGFRS